MARLDELLKEQKKRKSQKVNQPETRLQGLLNEAKNRIPDGISPQQVPQDQQQAPQGQEPILRQPSILESLGAGSSPLGLSGTLGGLVTDQGREQIGKSLETNITGKELFSNVVRPTIEGGTSLLASTLAGGATLSNPLTAPATPEAIALAGALGFGVGKTASDALSRFFGFKKPIKDLPEAAKETVSILTEGAELEALGLVGGAVLGKIINESSKLGKGLFKRIKIPGREKRIMAAKQFDIPLSIAEEAGTTFTNKIEGAFDLLPFSSKVVEDNNLKQANRLLEIRSKEFLKENKNPVVIEQLGEKIQSQINKFIQKNDLAQAGGLNDIKNSLLRRLGSNETIDQLGFNAQEAINQNSKDLFEQSQVLFSKVDETLKTLGLEDTQIVDNNLKSVSKKLLKRFDNASPSILKKNTELIGFLKDFSNGNLDKAAEEFLSATTREGKAKLKNAVSNEFNTKGKTWKGMQLIRETLNSIIEEKSGIQGLRFQKIKKGGPSRPYVLLKKALDQDLEGFAKKEGGEVLETFKIANSFFSDQKKLFGARHIVDVTRAKISRVIDVAVRPNSTRDVQTLKKALGEKNIKLLEDGFITNILEMDKTGTFSPDKALKRFDKFGESTLTEVIGEKKLTELTDILKKGITIENIPSLANNSVFRDILGKKPAKILDSILVKDNILNVTVAKQILPKEAIDNLKQASLEKIFTLERDLLSPAQLSKNVEELAVPLKTLFSENPKTFEELSTFAKGASLARGAESLLKGQKSGISLGGKILIASELGFSFFNPISGATLLVGPKVIAELWFSKAGRNLLLKAASLNIITNKETIINEGARIFTKISAIVAKQRLNGTETKKTRKENILQKVGKVKIPQKRKVSIKSFQLSQQNDIFKKGLSEIKNKP